jgi:hypothetical protein
MVHVLVMGTDSLLADTIMSNLIQEPGLNVLRVKHCDPSRLRSAIRRDCSVVIIVEEEAPDAETLAINDLFEGEGCFRVMTISSQKKHIHVCDSYQRPVSGLTQVIDLTKGFGRDMWNEVKE